MRLAYKWILVVLMGLILAACASSSLSFNGLNYQVKQPKQIGRMVLIVSPADAAKQITLPADSLGSDDDQTVSVGKMLLQMAGYEYPKIFSTYARVANKKAIPLGFYLSILSLGVENLAVVNQQMVLTIGAKYYDYQGKLLLQKDFTAKVPLQASLQASVLLAYRRAFAQVNNRLTQILSWEQRQTISPPLHQSS